MTNEANCDPGSQKDNKVTIRIDPEIVILIPRFMKNRELDIQVIEQAIPQNDFERIERVAHGMKGAGAGYGFDGVTEIGKQIEMSAQKKNVQEIQRGIQALALYMKNIKVVCEQ